MKCGRREIYLSDSPPPQIPPWKLERTVSMNILQIPHNSVSRHQYIKTLYTRVAKMIEILIPFQNLCLWIGEAHNWEWINWGLVQTAINQIWLGEKSENMKVFTTNHQHEDCYKYLQNCYKISSRYLKNIIKILKKCHQDFYKISCRYLQNIIKIFYKISPR